MPVINWQILAVKPYNITVLFISIIWINTLISIIELIASVNESVQHQQAFSATSSRWISNSFPRMLVKGKYVSLWCDIWYFSLCECKSDNTFLLTFHSNPVRAGHWGLFTTSSIVYCHREEAFATAEMHSGAAVQRTEETEQQDKKERCEINIVVLYCRSGVLYTIVYKMLHKRSGFIILWNFIYWWKFKK